MQKSENERQKNILTWTNLALQVCFHKISCQILNQSKNEISCANAGKQKSNSVPSKIISIHYEQLEIIDGGCSKLLVV